jgi:hypothetical protein
VAVVDAINDEKKKLNFFFFVILSHLMKAGRAKKLDFYELYN